MPHRRPHVSARHALEGSSICAAPCALVGGCACRWLRLLPLAPPLLLLLAPSRSSYNTSTHLSGCLATSTTLRCSIPTTASGASMRRASHIATGAVTSSCHRHRRSVAALWSLHLLLCCCCWSEQRARHTPFLQNPASFGPKHTPHCTQRCVRIRCKLSASIHNKAAVPPPRYGTFNKITKSAVHSDSGSNV